MDSTINWTSELSEGTPIPDYYWFGRDSEIARTEYMSTYLHNLLYKVLTDAKPYPVEIHVGLRKGKTQ